MKTTPLQAILILLTALVVHGQHMPIIHPTSLIQSATVVLRPATTNTITRYSISAPPSSLVVAAIADIACDQLQKHLNASFLLSIVENDDFRMIQL